MKILFYIIYIVLITPSVVYADNEPNIIILSLLKKIDGIIESRIDLYANDFDPNSSSRNDRYVLEVDGKPVSVPHDLLRSLDFGRRSFSYNSLSGGIVSSLPPKRVCLLGGPSVGYIIQTRYLTYFNHKIIDDKMKSVYSESGNCLFINRIFPRHFKSEKIAAKAMATLKTIATLTSDQHESQLNQVEPWGVPVL